MVLGDWETHDFGRLEDTWCWETRRHMVFGRIGDTWCWETGRHMMLGD